MDYVRGVNLEELVRRERPTPRVAASIVAKLASALAVVHRKGIIHQDIKPSNVLQDDAGQPRLIDFGIARLRYTWNADKNPGVVGGTVPYMSPEQARNDPKQIGPRSDIFGLGGVLYYLLAGKAPFEGKTFEACLERARRCDWDSAALRVAGVPAKLQKICQRAMAADPANRYATAEDLGADLDRFLRSRDWMKWALTGALAATLAGGLIWFASRPPTGREVPTIDLPNAALQQYLPLRSGDRLQFRCKHPHASSGWEFKVFWFDTRQQVRTVRAKLVVGENEDYLYVPSADASLALDEHPGTELILVCANRNGKSVPTKEVEAFFKGKPALPALAPDQPIRFNREGVLDEVPRGFDDPPSAAQEVSERLEELRLQLHCDFLVGLAFLHQAR